MNNASLHDAAAVRARQPSDSATLFVTFVQSSFAVPAEYCAVAPELLKKKKIVEYISFSGYLLGLSTTRK
jgi:hypothetical protein